MHPIHKFFMFAPVALIAVRWHSRIVLGVVEPAGYLYSVSMVIFLVAYYGFVGMYERR